MSVAELEKVCPLCGKDNNCMHGEGECWCSKIIIPKHILEMVPDDKKGKVCVCKACIEKYQRSLNNC
jgi:hypothetical protein